MELEWVEAVLRRVLRELPTTSEVVRDVEAMLAEVEDKLRAIRDHRAELREM
jgi:hypothetical protein